VSIRVFLFFFFIQEVGWGGGAPSHAGVWGTGQQVFPKVFILTAIMHGVARDDHG